MFYSFNGVHNLPPPPPYKKKKKKKKNLNFQNYFEHGNNFTNIHKMFIKIIKRFPK